MIIVFNIKSIRKKKGISLKQLSYKTGISTTHLCDIERNFKMPSLIYAIKIAKALNVNIDTIYEIKRY
jgi:transcriptional regulator with XRE-family HTH domain